MYKAIFLDLDGTLLNNDKNISQENIAAIKYAKDKGVYVCLCSGRQKDAVKAYKEVVNSSRYIICSNGAQIYDCESNEEIYSCNIDSEVCEKLSNYAIDNNYYIVLETNYSRYISSEDCYIKDEILLKDNEELFKIIRENKILQFTIATKTEKEIRKVENFINSLNINDFKIENVFPFTKDPDSVWVANMINKNASKGNAVNGLCRYLKIDMEDVIAMGDDANDLSMIKMAGLGVAMGNSIEDVKKQAKEVTKTNNENGVAEIIKSKI